MKKIILGVSVLMMTLVSAQNYPDYYPNGPYNNGTYYGADEDAFYFPDDYYYEYPSDYYSNDLYRSYYDDYRRSIADVNWNRFFQMQRLSPWQVQQVLMLNDSFASYAAWNSYYRYNPDRWYYDRFYALQRILGPSVFVVFQNNYYNGYNPVVYYQNYNRRHYARNIYVVPRYRNVNVNVYRINRTQFHQSNPRASIGFQPAPRTVQTQAPNNRENGFRNDTNIRSGNTATRSETITRNDSRANSVAPQRSETRSNAIQRESVPQRNDATLRNNTRSVAPQRVETSRSRNTAPSGTRTPAANSRNSGQRFTSR